MRADFNGDATDKVASNVGGDAAGGATGGATGDIAGDVGSVSGGKGGDVGFEAGGDPNGMHCVVDATERQRQGRSTDFLHEAEMDGHIVLEYSCVMLCPPTDTASQRELASVAFLQMLEYSGTEKNEGTSYKTLRQHVPNL